MCNKAKSEPVGFLRCVRCGREFKDPPALVLHLKEHPRCHHAVVGELIKNTPVGLEMLHELFKQEGWVLDKKEHKILKFIRIGFVFIFGIVFLYYSLLIEPAWIKANLKLVSLCVVVGMLFIVWLILLRKIIIKYFIKK